MCVPLGGEQEKHLRMFGYTWVCSTGLGKMSECGLILLEMAGGKESSDLVSCPIYTSGRLKRAVMVTR